MTEGQQPDDFVFTLRERVVVCPRPLFGLSGHQARPERRMHVPLPVRHLTYCRHDLGVGGLLEDVAARTCPKGLPDVGSVVLHRENEHVRARRLLEQVGDDLDPASARHDQVEEHDVGLVGPRFEDRAACVRGLRDHLHVLLGLEQQPEARPDDGVVVDDEDACAQRIGTSTDSVVP